MTLYGKSNKSLKTSRKISSLGYVSNGRLKNIHLMVFFVVIGGIKSSMMLF
jgi:hypothetical protein